MLDQTPSSTARIATSVSYLVESRSDRAQATALEKSVTDTAEDAVVDHPARGLQDDADVEYNALIRDNEQELMLLLVELVVVVRLSTYLR